VAGESLTDSSLGDSRESLGDSQHGPLDFLTLRIPIERAYECEVVHFGFLSLSFL